MEFGCDIRVGLYDNMLSQHAVIESGVHAYRLLSLPPSQLNFAKGRAPSSSTTPKSSPIGVQEG